MPYSASASPSVTLAGRPLEPHYHACAFFHSAAEEYQVLAPFIREGLEAGEKAIHVTDSKLHADHLARLQAAPPGRGHGRPGLL